MSNAPVLLTFASWEDRFREGSFRLIGEHRPQKVLMYFFDGYAAWTAENREKVRAYCEATGSSIRDFTLSVTDPASNWKTLRETIKEHIPKECEVVVDLSTMPRELIWALFWFLDLQQASIQYVYHRPKQYGEWLSRDPQRPRLVFKMSGLSKLGARTALIVLPGYDVDRTKHLINFFEPAMTLLGLQKQNQDAANSERMQQHVDRLDRGPNIHLFEVDAFANDHGQSEIEGQLQTVLANHNVIMSSLGPKLSAVALYRIHRTHPECGLAYAPSREFNQDYSTGIGETIRGKL